MRKGSAAYREHVRAAVEPRPGATEPSYAQVIAAVNSVAEPDDYAVSSAAASRASQRHLALARVATFDCEYGFSCMGYELAGRGARAWRGSEARFPRSSATART